MGFIASDSRRRIFFVGGLALLLIVATALGASYSLRESTRKEWLRHMDSLSLILAEQAGQTLFSAHTVLNGLVDTINQAHLPDAAAFRTYGMTEARFQVLSDRANSNPIIDVVTLVSMQGDVINFSRTFPPPLINLADHDYFKAHRDDPALQIFTSAPVRNKGNGKWVFYISRRVNNSQGEMLGLVLVGVSVDAFSRFYERVGSKLGEGAAIGLYRDDATLMTRWPLVDERIGRKEADPGFRTMLEGRALSYPTTDTGVLGLVAPRLVESYPLMVVPMVTQSLILQNWRSSVWWIVAATAMSLLLLLAGLRSLLQAEQSRRSASESLEARVAERTRALTTEIAERERAQQQLAINNARIASISHSAGKAEVANSVLHNVGNVLNSVNVSISVIRDQLQRTVMADFPRTVGLLEAHAHELPRYLTQDSVGQQVPAFLQLLAGQWQVEQRRLLAETEQLERNVDHIKNIVSRQQSFSGQVGISDAIDIGQVIEESLAIHRDAIESSGIDVQVDISFSQRWTGDRSKLAQIVLNLVVNAQESVALSARAQGRLDVTAHAAPGDVLEIAVSDNGLGIPEAVLPKLFQYGFTTKRTGHGFGLHASALAAQEMGGTLKAFSAGANQGATFQLTLPLHGSASGSTP